MNLFPNFPAFTYVTKKIRVTSKQSLWPDRAHSSGVDWCSACLWAEENCWQQLAAWSLLLKCDARCRAVKFFWPVKVTLFLIDFVNLFVTAWSWYGHFSKCLFSLNLWLVVLHIDWPCFFGIYLWTYRCKGIQELSWTSRKFSEAGLFEYQV